MIFMVNVGKYTSPMDAFKIGIRTAKSYINALPVGLPGPIVSIAWTGWWLNHPSEKCVENLRPIGLNIKNLYETTTWYLDCDFFVILESLRNTCLIQPRHF